MYVYCILYNHTTLLLYMHWIKSTRTVLKKRMRQKIYIILHSSKLKMIVLGWIRWRNLLCVPNDLCGYGVHNDPGCDWSFVQLPVCLCWTCTTSRRSGGTTAASATTTAAAAASTTHTLALSDSTHSRNRTDKLLYFIMKV